jgi:DNA-binding MarR family transcriptional regulator
MFKTAAGTGNFSAGGAFEIISPKVVAVLAENDPLRDLDIKEAIDLRWTLRDIKAKRWNLSPINSSHLERLKAMGLVEMRNDELVLTNAGFDAIP